MAYLALNTNVIEISKLDAERGWPPPQPIPGTKGTVLQSRWQPALGGVDHNFHLVYSGTGTDDQVYWSYWTISTSTAWALPVGSPGQKMYGGAASLAAAPCGHGTIMMVHPSSEADHQLANTALYYSVFQ